MQDSVPPAEQSPAAQGPSGQEAPLPTPTPTAPETTSTPPAPPDCADEEMERPAPPPDADAPKEAPPSNKGPSVIVRFGRMGHIGQFRCNIDPPPVPSNKVVIRTDRGVELGTVVVAVGRGPEPYSLSPEVLRTFLASNGPDYPFGTRGRVLRAANAQDIIDQRHLEESAREEGAYCREQIRELDLSMHVVAVEHLLGGERIVLYFTAETRVDFRELVRRLAGQYRTRIEMRQVGARDEARLVGDYERCGQQCCCRQFLKDLRPVSMRMAKAQKATLDPAKISGRCGRLMCCLRYEDACYVELRRKLPKKGIWVRTEDLVGRVVDTQILTQLVRLALPDGTTAAVANEDILDRDVEPPPPLPRTPRPPARRETKAEVPEVPEVPEDPGGPEAPEPTPDADAEKPPAPSEEQGPRRRRRRGGRSKRQGSEKTPQPADPQRGSQASASTPQNKSKRRRSSSSRRRGRRHGGDGQSPPQSKPPGGESG